MGALTSQTAFGTQLPYHGSLKPLRPPLAASSPIMGALTSQTAFGTQLPYHGSLKPLRLPSAASSPIMGAFKKRLWHALRISMP